MRLVCGFLGGWRWIFELPSLSPWGQQQSVPGDGGWQCADSNYAYPWQDNFCEARSWNVSDCPSAKGHQGQDIRPAQCPDSNGDGIRDKDFWVVATEAGTIQSIGTYTVYLTADSGRKYRFMHLDHSTLQVAKYDRVNPVIGSGFCPTIWAVHQPPIICILI